LHHGDTPPPPPFLKKTLEFFCHRLSILKNLNSIFVIFRNDLNEFWDFFYHGTNVGAGSPKAYYHSNFKKIEKKKIKKLLRNSAFFNFM
jgi:hypothetical protein